MSGEPAKYSSDDLRRLDQAQVILGYKFQNLEVLRIALTHSSAKSDSHPSNERMEFLGDAVLGLIVSEMLFKKFPEFPEGELTRVKSVAVSRAMLAERIMELGVADLMYLGKGVRRDKSASLPTSILANLYEGLLCALYDEGGLEAAEAFIERDLGPVIEKMTSHQFQQNYKSALQHLVQARQERAPNYKVTQEVGPDHQKEFHVVVHVDGDGDGDVRRVELGSVAGLTDEIDAWRDTFGVSPLSKAAGRRLRHRVWSPLLPHVDGANTII
ncbi:MAG: ribonuclease III, partial [Planctomycetes bacterium]|nr:ribonuclease III [Planctomycetota bacterium]